MTTRYAMPSSTKLFLIVANKELRHVEVTMPPKNIEKLFEFLRENHEYNKKIQEDDINRTLASYGTVEERALRLLYEIVNTQSQPKMEPIAKFFQHVHKEAKVAKALNCFESFRRCLDRKATCQGDIFKALDAWDGWGPKTSALFVRNLAVIEANPALREMFWTDIGDMKNQKIRLPVDKVILAIFRHLKVEESNQGLPLKTFQAINDRLQAWGYGYEEMLIWDDLWFWGFITQWSKSEKPKSNQIERVRGEAQVPQREHGWNPEKYWSIFTAPKDASTISEIERRAETFLKITEATPLRAKATPHASATTEAE